MSINTEYIYKEIRSIYWLNNLSACTNSTRFQTKEMCLQALKKRLHLAASLHKVWERCRNRPLRCSCLYLSSFFSHPFHTNYKLRGTGFMQKIFCIFRTESNQNPAAQNTISKSYRDESVRTVHHPVHNNLWLLIHLFRNYSWRNTSAVLV
jgi:hypothetical protein